MQDWIQMIKQRLSNQSLMQLLVYLLVTLMLVACGVVYFTDLPRGNVTVEPLTQSMRDAYEGYTVYLSRAALLVGVALGLYAAAIGRQCGMSFGLAMLLTIHLFNAILFMVALPPVRAGDQEFLAGLFYHASALIPAALAWLLVTASDWAARRRNGPFVAAD